MGIADYNAATWGQNFVASVAGASASLIVSAPLDVIKTRIQNRNFDDPRGGFTLIKDLLKNEGATALFKGKLQTSVFVDTKATDMTRRSDPQDVDDRSKARF